MFFFIVLAPCVRVAGATKMGTGESNCITTNVRCACNSIVHASGTFKDLTNGRFRWLN